MKKYMITLLIVAIGFSVIELGYSIDNSILSILIKGIGGGILIKAGTYLHSKLIAEEYGKREIN